MAKQTFATNFPPVVSVLEHILQFPCKYSSRHIILLAQVAQLSMSGIAVHYNVIYQTQGVVFSSGYPNTEKWVEK